MRHNVTGYVRNVPGGVELVVEGPDQEINEVVQAVKQRMSDYIHHIDENQTPATGEFPHFSIRHC